jgi:hypothetical protein
VCVLCRNTSLVVFVISWSIMCTSRSDWSARTLLSLNATNNTNKNQHLILHIPNVSKHAQYYPALGKCVHERHESDVDTDAGSDSDLDADVDAGSDVDAESDVDLESDSVTDTDTASDESDDDDDSGEVGEDRYARSGCRRK